MNKQEIFKLYEKLYFHEVDAREKISGLLQIHLAILLSITSVLAYIVKGNSLESISQWPFYFMAILSVSVGLYVTSFFYFIRGFYGHSYEFIPAASVTEEYRNKLIDTYKGYKNSDGLVNHHFQEYLYRYYNECSSINTIANDNRSEALHKCNTYFLLTAIPLTVAFLIYSITGLDKNSIDKEYKVNIVNPINIDTEQIPLNVDGDFKTGLIQIDVADDIKEMLHARQSKPAAASTSTSTPEENYKGRREDTNKAKSTEADKSLTIGVNMSEKKDPPPPPPPPPTRSVKGSVIGDKSVQKPTPVPTKPPADKK